MVALSPNMKVFLGTTGILTFCYVTFYGIGPQKKKPQGSLFDSDQPKEITRMLDKKNAEQNK
jgi:hypothetical protein